MSTYNYVNCSRASLRRAAFTLLELSLVFVIVGLIIGSLLISRDLIEGAEVRRFLSEQEKINAQANSFRLKYQSLPGDMANAYNIFGSRCHSSNIADRCNGDGNSSVDLEGTGAGANMAWYSWRQYNERCMFWKHLFLAGLRETGDYRCDTDNGDVMRTMSPLISPNKRAYTMVSAKCVTGFNHNTCNIKSEIMPSPHYLFTGGLSGDNIYFYTSQGAGGFSTVQAKGVDTKVDDGLPITGNIIVPLGLADPDTSSDACINNSNDYDTVINGYICDLRVKMNF